jgi:hypothetical protein
MPGEGARMVKPSITFCTTCCMLRWRETSAPTSRILAWACACLVT